MNPPVKGQFSFYQVFRIAQSQLSPLGRPWLTASPVEESDVNDRARDWHSHTKKKFRNPLIVAQHALGNGPHN